MTKFLTRIGTGLVTASLLATSAMPAFAGTTVTVNGNGNKSDNTVKVKNKSTTTVSQSNNTVVGNIVLVDQNTGGNTANGNTGGDVTIKTGKAKTVVSADVTGGSNTASLPDCGCDEDTNVRVRNNGNKSNNTVKVKNKHKTEVGQGSNTFVLNLVGALQNTGDNQAKNNTNGDVEVTTDNAVTDVTTSVSAGDNEVN